MGRDVGAQRAEAVRLRRHAEQMGLTAAKSRTRNPFAEDYLQWSLWRGDKLLFAGQIDEAVAWLDARKREAAAARTI